MKKSLFLIVLLSFFIQVEVSAENIFNYEFKTGGNEGSVVNFDYIQERMSEQTIPYSSIFGTNAYTQAPSINLDYMMSTSASLIPFHNGYIGIDVSVSPKKGTNLTYYDSKGNVIKQNFLDNNYIITGSLVRYYLDLTIEYNKKLYCIAVSPDLSSVKTLVINESLDIEQTLDNRIVLNRSKNKFYFLNLGKGLETSDLELNNFASVDISFFEKAFSGSFEPTLANITNLIEEAKPLLEILPKYRWVVDIVLKDLPSLLVNIDNQNEVEKLIASNPIFNLLGNVYFVDVSDNYILVVDKKTGNYKVMNSKGEYILDKNFETLYKSTGIKSVQIIHDYLFVLTNEGAKIDIYNMSGEFVQTFSLSNGEDYAFIKETTSGFTAVAIKSNQLPTAATTRQSVSELLIPTWYDYSSYIYSMPVPVTVNVVGNGNVQVLSSARFGEDVAFSIDKQDGYMLKKIRVYDAKENEIEVSNNVFKMPNSGVRIEAEFVEELKENPKTGLISLTLVAVIGLVLGIYYKANNKKLTSFKKI